jgi:hypothetical protein
MDLRGDAEDELDPEVPAPIQTLLDGTSGDTSQYCTETAEKGRPQNESKSSSETSQNTVHASSRLPNEHDIATPSIRNVLGRIEGNFSSAGYMRSLGGCHVLLMCRRSDVFRTYLHAIDYESRWT